MDNLLAFFKGKKTYLIAAALSLLAVVWNLDLSFHDNPATDAKETAWLSDQWYGAIKLLLEGGGLAALRAGFARK